MKIHPEYKENERKEDEVFRGTFTDLKGGEYLGHTTQPSLFKNHQGNIVVCTNPNEIHPHDFYYDPEMRIQGSHYVSTNGSFLWLRIYKPTN